MAEAYRVNLEKFNYHAPIGEGLNPIETYKAREAEIQDNVVRYIGEYRLGVKFDEYYYKEEQDPVLEDRYLSSSQPGRVRDVFRKTIDDREMNGLSVRREVAECLGFEKLEKEMLARPVGTMAIWVSPPGSTEEGYGPYSFTFIAQSLETDRGKQIKMIPYRNEFSIDEHNSYLSQVTGVNVEFQKDTQFLSTPIILEQSEELQSPEDILRKIGETEQLDSSWREDFTERAWPLIQCFLYLVKIDASDSDLEKALRAIENFALAYKLDPTISLVEKIGEKPEVEIFKFDERVAFKANMVDVWGKETPPVVLGSCGKTALGVVSGLVTLNPTLPMEFQSLYNRTERVEDDPNLCKCGGDKPHFHCPGKKEGKECSHKIIVGKGITRCSNCGEGKKC